MAFKTLRTIGLGLSAVALGWLLSRNVEPARAAMAHQYISEGNYKRVNELLIRVPEGREKEELWSDLAIAIINDPDYPGNADETALQTLYNIPQWTPEELYVTSGPHFSPPGAALGPPIRPLNPIYLEALFGIARHYVDEGDAGSASDLAGLLFYRQDMNNPLRRDIALEVIASMFMEKGNHQGALECSVKIADPAQQYRLLQEIALRTISEGEYGLAWNVIGSIPIKSSEAGFSGEHLLGRNRLLQRMAFAAFEGQDYEYSMKAVGAMTAGSPLWEDTLVECADRALARDDPNLGLRFTAPLPQDSSRRAGLLEVMVNEYYDDGNQAKALEVVSYMKRDAGNDALVSRIALSLFGLDDFAHALEAAGAIVSPDTRDSLLGQLAQGALSVKAYDNAFSAIGSMASSEHRDAALQDLVESFRVAGDYEPAMRAVSSINDRDLRDSLLLSLGKNAAEGNEPDIALTFLSSITPADASGVNYTEEIDTIYSMIVGSFLTVGNDEKAFLAASLLEQGEEKDGLIARISAMAVQDYGFSLNKADFNRALTYMSSMHDRELIDTALYSLGSEALGGQDLSRAMRVASSMTPGFPGKQSLLAGIAQSQIAQEKYVPAIRTLSAMEGSDQRDSLLETIALGYLDRGQYVRAAEISSYMDSAARREGLLYAVADEQIQLIDLHTALATVSQMSDAGIKDQLLTQIGLGYVRIRRLGDAYLVASYIMNAPAHDTVLEKVTDSYIALVQYEPAVQTLSAIYDQSIKDNLLAEVTIGYAQVAGAEEAKKYAYMIVSPAIQEQVLSQLGGTE